MLRGIRRGMLRLHRLLGRGVDREVVVVDEIVRMDELEDGVADLVEAAVVKIDASVCSFQRLYAACVEL